MMPRLVIAIALTIAPPPAAARLVRGHSADPAAEVLAFERIGCAAYQRNDARAIDSLVADGYELTDSKGVITTKADDLKDAWQRTIEFTAFRNEGMKVTMFGNTAIVRGRTIVQGRSRTGDVVDIVVQFTDTVVRLDGRWQLVAGHVSRLAK